MVCMAASQQGARRTLGLLSSTAAACGPTFTALLSFVALLLTLSFPLLLLPLDPRRTGLLVVHYDHDGTRYLAATRHNHNPAPSPAPLPEFCDLSRGKWIPDASPPLYTNDTCRYIHPHRNCMQNGRPDRGYLDWRWEPSDCQLPPFDAALFLDLMHSKTLAFVGDSIARNHMEALTCALKQVEDPINLISDPNEEEFRWFYPFHNVTLIYLRSLFLVNRTVEDGLYKLNLDVPEAIWATRLAEFDVVIISTGYWYFRPSLYHVDGKILGANPESGLSNVTRTDVLSAMRIAWEHVWKHIITEFQGITMLRTVTVDHFENGSWSQGGACNRTQPFSDDPRVPPLPWMNNEINRVQVGEFEKAMASADDASKLKILNVTYSAYLRPDGHPGPYRFSQPDEPRNDCLHWCLPGPIDMWNQLVLHTLRQIYAR